MRAIVLHSTEGTETPNSDEGACSWWDNPASRGNCHYVCGDEVICFAFDDRNSWHANAACPWTVGVEIVGKAAQTGPSTELPFSMTDENGKPFEWLDAFSLTGLDHAARLCAYLCITHGIEVRRLDDREIRLLHAGDTALSGFLTHSDVTRALKSGSHTDPGKGFPMLQFLTAVDGWVKIGMREGVLIEQGPVA